jgi:hypothetical protein
MEKTAREWLMELKPEHRDLAIKNVNKLKTYPKIFLNNKYDSLHFTLIGAFAWINSKQGHEYWSEIYSQIFSNTYYDEEAKS